MKGKMMGGGGIVGQQIKYVPIVTVYVTNVDDMTV